MRRLIPALVAALFAAVTFSAYAVDQGTEGNPPPPAKHSKKKKKSKSTQQAPAVGQRPIRWTSRAKAPLNPAAKVACRPAARP